MIGVPAPLLDVPVRPDDPPTRPSPAGLLLAVLTTIALTRSG